MDDLLTTMGERALLERMKARSKPLYYVATAFAVFAARRF